MAAAAAFVPVTVVSGISVVIVLPASSVMVVVAISVLVKVDCWSSVAVPVVSVPVPDVLVAVAPVSVAVSEKLEHISSPACCAWISSSGEHSEVRQERALAAMAAWEGPLHWHPVSLPSQPTSVTAALIQAVYEGG